MWYELLMVVVLGVALHLSVRRRLIRHQQPPGSGPWRHAKNKHLEIRNTDIHKTIQGCKEVLLSTWREEDFAKVGEQMTPLEARAGPNLRLAENFGIENPFTTIDEDYHKDSKVRMTRALKTGDQQWRTLSAMAMEIARTDVERQERDDIIQLVPLVQSIVVKVVLLKFFPDSSKIDDDDAVANIARLINRIWMDSKGSMNLDSRSGWLNVWKETLKRHLSLDSVSRYLAELKKNLACVLPTECWEDPRSNPLNIILPTYETLWRVVFHCTVEVLFRHKDRSILWKKCFSIVEKPFGSNREFSLHEEVEPELSKLDIVDEALRLYPPTKRIYRWEQRKNEHGTLHECPELCAADIQSVHRDENIWGPDALQFNPARWLLYNADERRRMKESFIPFGIGSLSCPAKGDFAPKMIALLVGVLVKALGNEFDWDAELDDDRVDGAVPLRTERDSYATLKLRRLAMDSSSGAKVVEEQSLKG